MIKVFMDETLRSTTPTRRIPVTNTLFLIQIFTGCVNAHTLTTFSSGPTPLRKSTNGIHQRSKQLILSNTPITVGRYFLDNLHHPSNAVRLWTANWSIPMIEDLYATIKTQQYPQIYSPRSYTPPFYTSSRKFLTS